MTESCPGGVCTVPDKQVRAVKCEVYSRVVGYYRPVQDWNRGKQEEFSLRANVDVSER